MSDNKRAWCQAIKARARKINGYQQHGRILVPEKLKTELHEYCGACGEPFAGKRKALHFGEYFHELCVAKMQNGFKP